MRKTLKKNKCFTILGPETSKHNINFCLASKFNSDARNQSPLKTSKPPRYPPYLFPQCLDPSVQIQHTETSLSSHLFRNHVVCNQSPRFPSQRKQSKTVKRTGHSCELGSPYTET